MKVQAYTIKEVTLEDREVSQLWRLLKNECENPNSETGEQTTFEMYRKLKKYFEAEEKTCLNY
jgi:hypothetical protein